ncbi:ThuA domain-containing protein [Altererythrobacter sp. MF3-039]|uniref:ThuA domain-containing protein n=1 Tax=Altererythrobacter sp. MF3-039 TaxID=3252901 RepID=UPI00390CABB2
MGQQPATRIDAHFVAAGKYHDIDYARLELLKLLLEHPHIRTTVAQDYSGLERLDQCRFLVTYTCDLVPTEEQAKQLRSWLEAGGKWLALHGTNSILVFTEEGLVDAPDSRADFMEIVGTQFKAHPPIGQFEVEVVNKTHELTKGIEDFEIVDELYLSNTTAPIVTLMQTTFEGEATGFVKGEWDKTSVPILYTRDIGKGRIVYNALGHCRGHYDLPGMQDFYPHKEMCAWNYDVYYDLLRRGIAWAMREES